jgi:hypothetical protein
VNDDGEINGTAHGIAPFSHNCYTHKIPNAHSKTEPDQRYDEKLVFHPQNDFLQE